LLQNHAYLLIMFLFLFAGFGFLTLHITQKFLKNEQNDEVISKRLAILSKYRKAERLIAAAALIGYTASSFFKLDIGKWVFLLTAISITLINLAKYAEAKKV